MGITIKLDTQADKTAESLRSIAGGLKDVKTGAKDAREEIEKIKRAEEDQRKLAQALGTVSNAFQSVGTAVKRHQEALARCSEVHARITAQNNPLAQSFAAVTRAMEHENELLERIHGPAQRLSQDMAALDKLHRTGKITAEQYIATIEKLGHKIEAMPHLGNPLAAQQKQTNQAFDTISMGRDDKGALNKAKPAGGGFDPMMMAGGAAAAAGLVTALAAIDDQYNKLENSARKFTDAGHNSAEVLGEQRRLAHELKMELGETMGAYDSVRDATDQLNMTHQQQIRETQTLGEAAALSGKSIEVMSEKIMGLKVAFETGQDPGRQLRTLMRESPDLADHLTKSLHLTAEQIVDMSNDGRLGFQQLNLAMTTSTDDIDQKFGQRVKLWSSSWDEFKDVVDAPIISRAQFDEINDMDRAIQRITEDSKKLAAQWADQEFSAGLTTFKQFTDDALKKMNDIQNMPGFKIGAAYKASLGEAEVAMMNLTAAHKDGIIVGKAYETQYESLMTTMNHGELPLQIKLWHEINDQARDFQREFDTLIKMNRAGALSPKQFARGLEVVSSHRPEDPGDKFKEQLRQGDLRKQQDAIRKYSEAQAKAKKESDDWSASEKEVLEVLNMIETPAQKVAEQLDHLNKLYKDGKLTAEQFALAQKKVSEAITDTYSKQLTDNWNQALKDYEEQTKETNQRVAETFAPIAEEIGKMAAGVKTDWHAMVQQMLAELTKLLVIKGLKAAFGGVGMGDAAGSIGGGFMNSLLSGLAGHDAGTSFMVGGHGGGTDKQVVAFRADPRERVTVENAGQQANRSASGPSSGVGGVTQIKNVNVYDAKQAAYEALNSPQGHDLMLNWVAKNRDYLRGYLVK